MYNVSVSNKTQLKILLFSLRQLTMLDRRLGRRTCGEYVSIPQWGWGCHAPIGDLGEHRKLPQQGPGRIEELEARSTGALSLCYWQDRFNSTLTLTVSK